MNERLTPTPVIFRICGGFYFPVNQILLYKFPIIRGHLKSSHWNIIASMESTDVLILDFLSSRHQNLVLKRFAF